MANAESTYKNLKGLELKLFFDIDLKSEIILDFYYKGSLSCFYERELEELKSLILNHPYSWALSMRRENLKNEVLLPNGKLPLVSLSLWLTHQAIENYLGSERCLSPEKDILCLCFGISKTRLKREILNRPDYNLQALIAETMATSACGGCLEQILKTIKDLREEHGLIEGLNHSQTRIDKEGNWIKIKGMYPSELLIKMDQLKNIWMKREGIDGQFQIEIKNIEGHHVWLSVSPDEDVERNKKVLRALSDFWRSEIGALFFLHLIF